MLTDILTALGALVTGLVAIAAAIWRARTKGRREGRETAQTEAMRDAAERVEKGRAAVQRGRGAGDPDERLRRNDGQW